MKAQNLIAPARLTSTKQWRDLLQKEWHEPERSNILPEELLANSATRVSWKCSVCQHLWTARVRDRAIDGKGCPAVCAKKRRAAAISAAAKRKRALSIETEGSFADNFPQLLAEWDFEANELDPYAIAVTENPRVHWKCRQCAFRWFATITPRKKGVGCPQCGKLRSAKSRAAQRLRLTGSVALTHPQLLTEWDYEANEILPTELTASSRKIVHWICRKNATHRWSVQMRSRGAEGNGCPKCGSNVSKFELELRAVVEDCLQAANSRLQTTNCLQDYLQTEDLRSQTTVSQTVSQTFSQTNNSCLQDSLQDCLKCCLQTADSCLQTADRVRLQAINKAGLQAVFNDRTILEGREIDILIPALGIGIEADGEYFHSEDFLQSRYGVGAVEYHSSKDELAALKGIKLYHVTDRGFKTDTGRKATLDYVRSIVESHLRKLDELSG